MGRVIKGRTWDEKNKQFHGWGFNIEGPEGPYFTGPPSIPNAPQYLFTGLHDKNGKEVYTGDLLSFDEEVWGCEFTPEEVPDLLSFVSDEFPMCGTANDVGHFREIIGNIHTHPHLLPNE